MSADPPRPFRLVGLALIVALISFGTAYTAITRPAALSAEMTLPPALDFVGGALWAAIFVFVALRLWRRAGRARRSFAWASIGWIGYSLARLSIFARADYDRERLPFLLLIGGIGCALIVFFLLRPRRIRAVITRSSDDEQQ